MKITNDKEGNIIIDVTEPDKLYLNSIGDVIIRQNSKNIDKEVNYPLLKDKLNKGIFDDISIYVTNK